MGKISHSLLPIVTSLAIVTTLFVWYELVFLSIWSQERSGSLPFVPAVGENVLLNVEASSLCQYLPSVVWNKLQNVVESEDHRSTAELIQVLDDH